MRTRPLIVACILAAMAARGTAKAVVVVRHPVPLHPRTLAPFPPIQILPTTELPRPREEVFP